MILLSPAKTLDFDTKVSSVVKTDLIFAEKAEYLAAKLQKLSADKLKSMMNISDNLAQLNYERFQTWKYPFGPEAKQAAFAFKGDVYLGLQIETFTKKELKFAQDHIRMLSGLYGMLRPMDLMLPYRLEMGTKWAVTPKKDSLYKFWKPELTDELKKQLEENKSTFLLNLASQEYAKAVDFKKIDIPVLAPEFKEERGGDYKMISFFAKKARGLMAAYAVKNEITDMEDLKGFNYEGYGFNSRLSENNKLNWVFTRKTK